ncbi:MAG TPA: branched-chain amino acid ABC transporter substrate-binding protein [Gaiellaceae bacterium]|jgi:branched-chain amino acid transport system substrate-binding protein|nr:branched-chain amino acid ABC transporter substrate-binding protein [Gaiellaceae bacterium]
MRKFIFALLVGALAFAAAGTGGASTASPNSAGSALVKCGKTRTLGLLAPITGPAASLGQEQVHWFKYYISRYNKTHKKTKFRAAYGDTILAGPGGTAEAVKAAQTLASNSKILAVVGPAGSNEVKATTPTIKNAGLGFVSGSATNTTLTTDGTRTGFFFRTVPPDSVQGAAVSNFIIKRLKLKRVYIIDDQEAYSTGLADIVQSKLRAAGVTVGRDGVSQQESDFSSLIAKIARNTQLVYLPWQVAAKAKAFADQMRSAGRGGIRLMGSDGLFDPAFAAVKGAYDSFFPVNAKDKTVLAYQRSHGGNGEYFGAPSYVAAQVIGRAVDRACKNGTASRAEVRTQIRRTRMGVSLLGIPVRFKANGDIRGGTFGIYQSNGTEFKPI